MKPKNDLAYAADVLEYARRAQTHAASAPFEEFSANEMMHDAVIRCFEVMGEATKRLSPEFREAHGGVNWAGIAGFRDVLAHGYERVDLNICWNILQNRLPETIAALEKIVPPES
jgi:uncharacterized protein with HEPN domain